MRQINSFCNWVERINYSCFLLFIVGLNINDRMAIYMLDLWVLSSLLDIALTRRWRNLSFAKKNWAYFAYILFFVIGVFSLLYSSNMNSANNILIRRLSLFVLPLIALFGFNKYYNFQNFLHTQILGSLLSVFLILAKSFGDVILSQIHKGTFVISKMEFFQMELQYFQHRTYWGLLGLISLLSIYYLSRNTVLSKKIKIVYAVFAVLITCILFLSESRAIVISFFFLVVIIAFIQVKERFAVRGKILTVIISISLIALTIYFLPRFQHLLSLDFLTSKNLQNVEPRILIWKSVWTVLKENWQFGVGIGDAQQELSAMYVSQKFELGANLDFNAHNQFLQSALEGGIPTVLFLLLLLVIQPVIVNREKRQFAFLLLVIFLINFFFESILNRICGILLFALVPVLLNLRTDNEKESKSIFPVNANGRNYFIILLTSISTGLFLFGFLYNPSFDPKDPRTFAMQPYTIIDVIDKPEIPANTKGFSIDSNYFNVRNDGLGNAYMVIKRDKVMDNDSVEFSIFCKLPGNTIKKRIGIAIGNSVSGFAISYLQPNSKPNEWTKISISKKFQKGIIYYVLIVKSSGQIDGDILIAHPIILHHNSIETE